MWWRGSSIWTSGSWRHNTPSSRPIWAHHHCILWGVLITKHRIIGCGVLLFFFRINHNSFSCRWVRMASLFWTNCSGLWPQEVLIRWWHLQTTPKQCTTSWTLFTKFCITRDSLKTSGNIAKSVCTSGCNSVCSSRMFNK